MKTLKIRKNAKILFIGDSITDSGRDYNDRHGLTGYNRIACEKLGDVEGFNRGVNGETCLQILQRLRPECEDIRPDVISVLGGINDTTVRGNPPRIASEAEFYDTYRRILRTAYEFTDQVMVVEPFLIPKDFGMDGLRSSLFERIYAIRRLANEFGAVYLPMDGIFAENWVESSADKYTADCIHLTAEGKHLLAEEWLKRVERV